MNKKLKILVLFLIFFQSPSFSDEYLINLEWFKNFQDERLEKCIIEALESNKDVHIARKNILKFRQDKNLSISKEFPTVNVGASYLLLKVPKLAIPNNDIQTNSFALPFNLSYELDYLLKNYNKIQKSKLDIENSIIDLKAANLMVASDVAALYFNISRINYEIELQEKIVKNLNHILKAKRKMLNFGIISEIELNDAEKSYLSEKSYLQNLYSNREDSITSILYYLGKTPSDRKDIVVEDFKNIEFKGKIPLELKGDIIVNRPDIMKLERELQKAKIDITIAKKDFLPSINVNGLLVFSTFVQNFNWKGAFAALMAGATQNIFDGGKRIFTLKKKKIEYEIQIENFLKSDLNALKELNYALYKLKSDYVVFENDEKLYKIANSNFIKVFNAYNSGVKSRLDYLLEDVSYIKSEVSLTQSKNQNFINLLTLYKASGGAL